MHGAKRLLLVLATCLAGAQGAQGAQGAWGAWGAAPAVIGPNFSSAKEALAALRRAFLDPPDDSRIMMRWWWFGPAVTDEELVRELEVMKAGGIGGVEVQPVYPVALDGDGIHTEAYLSDAFLKHLRAASDKAAALGLRFDLTLGSGWPYGGASVAVSQAAGRLRIERVPVPAGSARVQAPEIRASEDWLAAFPVVAGTTTPADAAAAPLKSPLDGRFDVPASATRRELLVFIAAHTGQLVKRAAVGAEGFVVDHYSQPALDAYLQSTGGRLWQAFAGGRPPYAIFCDSLEVFASDWTSRLLDTFRARRGYDLLPHLPALAGGRDAEAAAIRHDWGQTLTETLEQEFIAPLQSWAAAHGTKLRAQIYGMPPASTSSAAMVDLPEGEGADWHAVRASRWAASASHIAGKPVTSAETWTWLHSPAFRATPLDVKAEADRQFLQGVNQIVGHGWPYSPPSVDYPGWRFYAAAALNDRNPWWIVMPDVARALQRASFLLRQGEPVNDVAILLPVDDAWSRFEPGKVHLIDELNRQVGTDIPTSILGAGLNFDLVDPMSLTKLGQVEQGALRVGSMRYRVVVLPRVERIEPVALKLLDVFARGGGVLLAVGRMPERAPGFLATPADHQAVHALSSALFEGAQPPAHFVRDAGDLAATISRLQVADVALTPATPDIGVVHRHAGDLDIYFVANTSNMPRDVEARCRAPQNGAEWWDHVHGTTTTLAIEPRDGARRLSLHLAPYESGFVVFSNELGTVPLVHSGDSPHSGPHSAARITVTLTRMAFGDETSEPVRTGSWTTDRARQFYSGVVRYEGTFTAPPGASRGAVLTFGAGAPVAATPLKNGTRAWLDSPVREVAVVYVNGQRAGSVWCPPFDVALDGLLHEGENAVRIDVANLAVNAMAGRALPDYRLLNERYGTRFEPQDMDQIRAEPSGLLGPVYVSISR
jgi:alpha-L-rhamnosidase